ncbi:hypothetical protein HBI56_033290 [Parastagonospora nodorum]|nr:hypothetical protein HBH56_021080 [Parastagonospora nodorum]KAH3937476.1 hypothetical protein HBH54_013410 [Parastagonospora nodorum]KAH3944090.1 hypothetical protein HBH53_163340 [Parastagonospora nodorum]KAH3967602.1 hypothetical protein HBH51_137140 [Parastagonospora nodorum]KAH3990639.1 hypothetical protein HBH52_002350 [Parastagonospora nodorum]
MFALPLRYTLALGMHMTFPRIIPWLQNSCIRPLCRLDCIVNPINPSSAKMISEIESLAVVAQTSEGESQVYSEDFESIWMQRA